MTKPKCRFCGVYCRDKVQRAQHEKICNLITEKLRGRWVFEKKISNDELVSMFFVKNEPVYRSQGSLCMKVLFYGNSSYKVKQEGEIEVSRLEYDTTENRFQVMHFCDPETYYNISNGYSNYTVKQSFEHRYDSIYRSIETYRQALITLDKIKAETLADFEEYGNNLNKAKPLNKLNNYLE